jgi:vacuolar-type H+-ATPase subunit E/Vma4
MALQDILHIIVADAEHEAATIEQAGEAAYQARLQAAAAQAEALRAGILAEAQRDAEHEKARRLHRVKLEALREQVLVQEAAFKEAVRRSQQQLAQVRQQPDYATVLTQLLAEALAPFDEPVVVMVHPNDAGIIRDILSAPGHPPCQVEIDNNLAPGVVVRSHDGRLVSDNTLASRLQRALPDLHSLLSDLLQADVPAIRVPERSGVEETSHAQRD